MALSDDEVAPRQLRAEVAPAKACLFTPELPPGALLGSKNVWMPGHVDVLVDNSS